jgi:hypothetical protein
MAHLKRTPVEIVVDERLSLWEGVQSPQSAVLSPESSSFESCSFLKFKNKYQPKPSLVVIFLQPHKEMEAPM